MPGVRTGQRQVCEDNGIKSDYKKYCRIDGLNLQIIGAAVFFYYNNAILLITSSYSAKYFQHNDRVKIRSQ